MAAFLSAVVPWFVIGCAGTRLLIWLIDRDIARRRARPAPATCGPHHIDANGAPLIRPD